MESSREYAAGSKYVVVDCDTDSGDGGAGGGGVRQAAPGGASGDDGDSATGVLREQDRFLPIANVARIMKRAVPNNGKIAKEARECVQECVSEFISFITSEASDRCHDEKRKTINGEDILYAMSVLGFDNYVEPLKLFLQRYRESTKGDRLAENFEVEDTQLIGAGELAPLSPSPATAVASSATATASATQSSNGAPETNVIYTTYGNFS